MAASNKTVLDQHLSARNAHDLDRILATYTPSAVLFLNGQRIEGREAIGRFHDAFGFSGAHAGSFTQLRVLERRRHVAAEAIVVEQTLTGLHTGVWQEVARSGQSFEVAVCTVYAFAADGLIAGETIYFDAGSLRRQITTRARPPATMETTPDRSAAGGSGGRVGTWDVEPEHNLIAGRYRVQQILGRAGMFTIFKARDLLLNRSVAIKLVPPRDRVADLDFVARSARIAARLSSEHVVRVFDSGSLYDGTYCVVMECLEGRDLAKWIRNAGPLPVQRAADFVIQACDALAEAHALGMVHCDLKPSNLFATERLDGACIKILDFDMAWVSAREREPDPGPGVRGILVGTLLYMSPEQLECAPDIDRRADIWSLGITLFELLTGERPLEPTPAAPYYKKIKSGELRPLREVSPGLSDRLEAVVHRCLQPVREERYQSVGDLVLALLPFAPESSKPLVERLTRQGA